MNDVNKLNIPVMARQSRIAVPGQEILNIHAENMYEIGVVDSLDAKGLYRKFPAERSVMSSSKSAMASGFDQHVRVYIVVIQLNEEDFMDLLDEERALQHPTFGGFGSGKEGIRTGRRVENDIHSSRTPHIQKPCCATFVGTAVFCIFAVAGLLLC